MADERLARTLSRITTQIGRSRISVLDGVGNHDPTTHSHTLAIIDPSGERRTIKLYGLNREGYPTAILYQCYFSNGRLNDRSYVRTLAGGVDRQFSVDLFEATTGSLNRHGNSWFRPALGLISPDRMYYFSTRLDKHPALARQYETRARFETGAAVIDMTANVGGAEHVQFKASLGHCPKYTVGGPPGAGDLSLYDGELTMYADQELFDDKPRDESSPKPKLELMPLIWHIKRRLRDGMIEKTEIVIPTPAQLRRSFDQVVNASDFDWFYRAQEIEYPKISRVYIESKY